MLHMLYYNIYDNMLIYFVYIYIYISFRKDHRSNKVH